MTSLKRVELHPATIKHLKNGHFWVTEDSFTKRFPKNETFLIGIDSKTKIEFGLFINDQKHKFVKARLFSKNLTIDVNTEIKNRIDLSLKKREMLKIINERENIILVNAEADLLPGLTILLFKNQIIIQYFALYWPLFEDVLIKALNEAFPKYFKNIEIKNIWIQERNFEKKNEIRAVNKNLETDFILKEFDINYRILINEYYDYGIYTDMSAIRKSLLSVFQNKKSVLNLFSYTGAFSLFALKHGATDVHSVDLSKKYLDWLCENLKINHHLNSAFHTCNNSPSKNALLEYIKNKKEFDLIICDPPTSSSDGQKQNTALKSYEELLPLIFKSLSENGVAIIFLNTHQISYNKFEEKIKEILKREKLDSSFQFTKKIKTLEDCTTIKGFFEGDYLKGMILTKTKG